MFLNHILESYKASKATYQKKYLSKHWDKNNKKKIDLFTLKNLKNFRNNGLADGLGGGYFSRNQMYNMYKFLITNIGHKNLIKNLENKNIGLYTNTLKLKKKIIDANQLVSLKWMFDLKDKIQLKKLKVICEIGAGYGCFAQKIIKNSNAKYIIIDLPEANFLSSYYLKKHFPKKKFLLVNKIRKKKISQELIKNYDIIIINPWHKITNIKFDLFINIRSMMEMDFSTISSYFNLIHKKLRINGYFLNINRYEKNTVGESIQLAKYPYNDKWQILLSKVSWQQSHIHYLLSQKKKNKGNIHSELRKINYIRRKKIFIINKIFLKRYLPNFIYIYLIKIKNIIL